MIKTKIIITIILIIITMILRIITRMLIIMKQWQLDDIIGVMLVAVVVQEAIQGYLCWSGLVGGAVVWIDGGGRFNRVV